MSRFLVTGATGFIGGALVRRLAADGQEVVALHGSRQPPFEHSNVKWRAADLLSGDLVDLSSIAASHCIHAAWYTNHADYLTHDINRAWAMASRRLADAFFAAGGQRFIGLGTCLEYDVANVDGPCVEGRTPLRPDTLYARCKLELLETLERQDVDFAWARVFLVYGPHDRAGRLFPGMIASLSRGEQAGPRYGGLRRDYVHVDDLAGQLTRIATSSARGAINTGTGEAPTLSEIFAIAAQVLGHADLALGNEEMGDEPPLIQADLARFRHEVGEPGARDIASGLRDLLR